jgi:hypothetical protein
MKRKTIMYWLAMGIVLPAGLMAAPREQITLDYAIQAANRESAYRELKRWVESRKGYMIELTDSSISLRIPVKAEDREDRLEEIKKKVLSLGILMSHSMNRTDYTGRISELEVAIRMKEKHLDDLQKLARDTDLSQTLALEQELNAVQGELEQLKGQRRQLIEATRMIQLNVSFSYTPPVNPAGDPGFGWVNSAGVLELMEGFGE